MTALIRRHTNIPEQEKNSIASHAASIALRATTIIPSIPRDCPASVLFRDLSRAFEKSKSKAAIGEQINRFQSQESFQALHGKVRSLMEAYLTSGASDWCSFASFNEHHYVRHLVDANENFELVVLCWSPGQASRIHNHQDSHCWVTVLNGTVEELRYQKTPHEDEENNSGAVLAASPPKVPGSLAAVRPCPALQYVGTKAVSKGDSLYINDGMGLHVVRCPEGSPAPGAVTLHCYAPPISKVTLFEPDEDRISYRTPGYFSIKGSKV